MLRRVFAMLLALTFWTIQTADAAVLHVGSENPAMSIQADDTAQVSVEAHDDGAGKSEQGPATCTDGCLCHAFHHALVATPASATEFGVTTRFYVFPQDERPDHLSAPLSRPPLG